MRVAGWILAVVAAVVAVLTLDPARLGLSTTNGVAQMIGLRPWLAVGFAVLAVVAALRVRAGRRADRPRRRATVLLVVCTLVAAGHVAVLTGRGVGPNVVPMAAEEAADEITVITLNVHGGFDDARRIRDLIERTGADVVALPETASWFRELIQQRLDDAGMDFQMFDGEGSGSPGRGSVLLISAALGDYREVATPDGGIVRVESVDGTGPPIAVVHPISPKPWPRPGQGDLMARWRSELAAVRRLAADMPGGIIAGDLNATLDHEPLQHLPGYTDAAVAAGVGGLGTYPSGLPSLLSAAIDHIFVAPVSAEVTGAAVVRVRGTDHRAVVVRVRLL